MNEHIVVVSGSAALDPHVVAALPDRAIVIAVDGGLDHARAAGLAPSGLVGDLDSISDAGLAWAEEHATIVRHPVDKNHTDTELALAFAADMAPNRLTLVGAGDRLDHTITAVGALGHRSLTSIPHVDGWWNGQHVDVLHGPGSLELELVAGSMLSIVALHGPCSRVRLTGTKWTLDGVSLDPVVGWGVSNEVLDGAVTVRLSTGVLTIFDHPRPQSSPSARATGQP